MPQSLVVIIRQQLFLWEISFLHNRRQAQAQRGKKRTRHACICAAPSTCVPLKLAYLVESVLSLHLYGPHRRRVGTLCDGKKLPSPQSDNNRWMLWFLSFAATVPCFSHFWIDIVAWWLPLSCITCKLILTTYSIIYWLPINHFNSIDIKFYFYFYILST